MAYKPSRRRTPKTNEAMEPNMTPIMNLMVVLIPLLLSSAQLIKLSVIELNLPPASEMQTKSKKLEQIESKLDLSITITNKGFYISSSSAILRNLNGSPSIPLKNGVFDYEALAMKLYQIKGKASGRFEDTNSITIQAEPNIDYQTLVSTMDAARAIKVENEEISLFPKASVSAMIL